MTTIKYEVGTTFLTGSLNYDTEQAALDKAHSIKREFKAKHSGAVIFVNKIIDGSKSLVYFAYSKLSKEGRFFWKDFVQEVGSSLFAINHNFLKCENVLFHVNEYPIFEADSPSLATILKGNQTVNIDKDTEIRRSSDLNYHRENLYVASLSEVDPYLEGLWEYRIGFTQEVIRELQKNINKLTSLTHIKNMFGFFRTYSLSDFFEDDDNAITHFLFSYKLIKNGMSSYYLNSRMRKLEGEDDGPLSFENIDNSEIMLVSKERLTFIEDTNEEVAKFIYTSEQMQNLLLNIDVIISNESVSRMNTFEEAVLYLGSVLSKELENIVDQLKEELSILEKGFSYGAINQTFLEIV